MHRTKPLAVSIVRTLFALAFVVFGLDGFLHVLPQPTTPPPEGAMAFGLALMKSGYMFPLIKGTELAAGLLLLTDRFAPLGLALLAPVLVNIVAFHAFLAPDGLILALALVAIALALAWAYRDAYRSLVTPRNAGAPAAASR
jgi:uncharacterized membrane protein YphA (DoxX/SURF4 family)